jgi:hypothetical protein
MNAINHAENLQQKCYKDQVKSVQNGTTGYLKKKHEDILVTYYKDNVVWATKPNPSFLFI